jgi:hypothetical protein
MYNKPSGQTLLILVVYCMIVVSLRHTYVHSSALVVTYSCNEKLRFSGVNLSTITRRHYFHEMGEAIDQGPLILDDKPGLTEVMVLPKQIRRPPDLTAMIGLIIFPTNHFGNSVKSRTQSYTL